MEFFFVIMFVLFHSILTMLNLTKDHTDFSVVRWSWRRWTGLQMQIFSPPRVHSRKQTVSFFNMGRDVKTLKIFLQEGSKNDETSLSLLESQTMCQHTHALVLVIELKLQLVITPSKTYHFHFFNYLMLRSRPIHRTR